LTRSKQEANLPLTRVLLDPTKEIFFARREKIENLTFLVKIFQTLTQTIDG